MPVFLLIPSGAQCKLRNEKSTNKSGKEERHMATFNYEFDARITKGYAGAVADIAPELVAKAASNAP